jgi:uncharacterized membrane protein YkvA (DUF1232 family)
MMTFPGKAVRRIKRDVHALVLASGDPRVPWYAKAAAIVVVAYALSPIDLIPDFIPVLGYLDDAILVPLGILAVIKLIPADLLDEFRSRASDPGQERVLGRRGAFVIAVIWMLALTAALMWLAHLP